MTATYGDIIRDAETRLAAVSESPRLDAELLLAHALGISRTALITRFRDSVPTGTFEDTGERSRQRDASRDELSARAPQVPFPKGARPAEAERRRRMARKAGGCRPPRHNPTASSGLLVFEACLDRRLAHEPVAYILGHRGFYSLDFLVRPPVLIPRPETEHLVEVALAFAKEIGRPLRILDLCTGSGCVAVTLAHELPACRVTAVDIAPEAVALARENADRANVPLRILQGDLFDALPKDEAPFDLITANPPYVEAGEWDTLAPDITRYEDSGALLAGEDGLDCIRRIVTAAPNHLVPGGALALEIGENQYDAVAEILTQADFTEVRAVCDLAGIRRIISARRNT